MKNLLRSINELGGIENLAGKLFIGPYVLKGREIEKVTLVNNEYRFYFVGSGYVNLDDFDDKLFIDTNDMEEGFDLNTALKERLAATVLAERLLNNS